MRLLVSVRGPVEARAAVAGGADVVDATDAVASWIAAVRATGLFAALAGSLTGRDFATARALGAELVGVRGAACIGGRRGRVSQARVAALQRLVRAAPPPALPLGVLA